MTRAEFERLVREHTSCANACALWGVTDLDEDGKHEGEPEPFAAYLSLLEAAHAALLAAYDALIERAEDAEQDARDQRLRADQAEYAVLGYPPHEEVAALVYERDERARAAQPHASADDARSAGAL